MMRWISQIMINKTSTGQDTTYLLGNMILSITSGHCQLKKSTLTVKNSEIMLRNKIKSEFWLTIITSSSIRQSSWEFVALANNFLSNCLFFMLVQRQVQRVPVLTLVHRLYSPMAWIPTPRSGYQIDLTWTHTFLEDHCGPVTKINRSVKYKFYTNTFTIDVKKRLP